MKINMSSMDLNYILIPLGVSWLYDLGQMTSTLLPSRPHLLSGSSGGSHQGLYVR